MSKYTLNEKYFQEINTPAKAYILGFIYGDGCLTNRKHSTLAINVKDLDVLSFIKNELEYTGPIKSYRSGKIYSLRITNLILSKDLQKWGVLPNKSKVLKFPDFLSDPLLLHFVCGLFDADGYVYIPKEDNKWKQYRKLGFSGTKDIVSKVKLYLESKGFSKTNLKLEKCGTYTTHYVCKHVEMFNSLYKTSAYQLERKKKKFEDNEIVYTRLKG